jgi:hypothetical protein
MRDEKCWPSRVVGWAPLLAGGVAGGCQGFGQEGGLAKLRPPIWPNYLLPQPMFWQ